MPRTLRIFAVMVLLALLPLRAVAAVTIGFCATGHKDMAVEAQVAQAHGAGVHAHHHHGKDGPAQPQEPSCNTCAEHCASAAFAPESAPAVALPPVAREYTDLAERSVPPFIPDQPDRPPLA